MRLFTWIKHLVVPHDGRGATDYERVVTIHVRAFLAALITAWLVFYLVSGWSKGWGYAAGMITFLVTYVGELVRSVRR